MNWQRIKRDLYVDSTIKELKELSVFEIEEYLFKLSEYVWEDGVDSGYYVGEEAGKEMSDSYLESQISNLENEVDDLKEVNRELEDKLKELEWLQLKS
jgi:hypothetical protein